MLLDRVGPFVTKHQSLHLLPLSLYSVGGGAAPRASVSSPHRSSNKGPTLYCTLHLQCYKASTPGFDKVVLGRARRWIFGSWLVGLLPCLLVLRHARVPWSCLLHASCFRHGPTKGGRHATCVKPALTVGGFVDLTADPCSLLCQHVQLESLILVDYSPMFLSLSLFS